MSDSGRTGRSLWYPWEGRSEKERGTRQRAVKSAYSTALALFSGMVEIPKRYLTKYPAALWQLKAAFDTTLCRSFIYGQHLAVAIQELEKPTPYNWDGDADIGRREIVLLPTNNTTVMNGMMFDMGAFIVFVDLLLNGRMRRRSLSPSSPHFYDELPPLGQIVTQMIIDLMIPSVSVREELAWRYPLLCPPYWE